MSAGLNRHYNFTSSSDGSTIDSTNTPKDALFKFQLNHAGFHPVSKKVSVLEYVNIGYAENGTGIIFDEFVLGGIQSLVKMQLPFAGLNDGQLPSPAIASLGIGAQYNLFNEMYALVRINAACYNFENPFQPEPFKNASYISGAALSLAYYLSALPLEFSMMYSPDIDRVYSHVSIGFVF